jgi:broad specificity phosphatase PhoE
MSKIEIYIFRHGETDWNRERRFQGHTDIPLNENGLNQALGLRFLIERLQPEVILSSDLIRAKATADVANGNLNVPIHITKQLRECHLGEVEGMFAEKMAEVFSSETRDKWLSIQPADDDFKFPQGETKKEHLYRMIQYIENFIDENPQYQRIAISTHGGSLRRLIHNCMGAPTEPVMMGNCVLYKVSFNKEKKEWHFGGLVD